MAQSHISGLKMRKLLCGVLFVLAAVVHSSPVDTATQEDVYRDAETDGFLVGHSSTELLKRRATVQPPEQPSSEATESDMIEGSAAWESDTSMTSLFSQFGGKQHETSTLSGSHAQSSTTDDSSTDRTNPDSPSTSILDSDSGSGSGPDSGSGSGPDSGSDSGPDSGSGSGSGFGSGFSSGSGDGELHEDMLYSSEGFTTTSPANTETITTSSTSTAAPNEDDTPIKFEEGQRSGSAPRQRIVEIATNSNQLHLAQPKMDETVDKVTPQMSTGQSTPGWIIIVAFIVGVAALVMLCVAIATRDKWNGPKQASQLETKANSSNQQRELEMETFLHKEEPRENGKAAEYTVIPLDELPDKYSSH